MSDNNSSSNGNPNFYNIINGGATAGAAANDKGITTKAFALNLATGLALFLFEVTGFFLLKSSSIGRRIYQPKTYLVQDRLRVEAVPANPWKWISKIFKIKDEELKVKCGLDGYFYIRFIRAMIVIFLPLMIIIVTVLLPVNYHGGKNKRAVDVSGEVRHFNVTGLDTLSWQNVAPTETNRYWAHLVCALLAIGWTLYRIYREKIHFIDVRQQFLASPEHRLKASARTVLITNIPTEYRSDEALKTMYDIFVGDDRTKLQVWVNRDYSPLKSLIMRRRKVRHALEKEELKLLRLVNKKRGRSANDETDLQRHSADAVPPAGNPAVETKGADAHLSAAFEADCRDHDQLWRRYLKGLKGSQITLTKADGESWKPASWIQTMRGGEKKSVPKIAWLRAEIARLTVQVEELERDLDSDTQFKRQNSAFIQFDRQMAAQMAVSLVSHHQPGRMTPRVFNIAPHEILWPNMRITSFSRFIRQCIAMVLFPGMILLWGLPTTFLGFLSQLDNLRETTDWLLWLRPWPSYVISLIAGE